MKRGNIHVKGEDFVYFQDWGGGDKKGRKFISKEEIKGTNSYWGGGNLVNCQDDATTV